ncbi:MAG: CCA tRNA nucleotidyltransferase [Bryobacterales bacterium]|nr:CCA tRNA nucleotidyltransferase [Bryobacterales bacterium]
MDRSGTTGAELARSVVRSLRAHGRQAYLVGGCVRDILLGRRPKDFDVATDARPEQILGLFPDARQAGAHFGVMLVRREGAEVEVATFRSEQAYSDGRHPGQVAFESGPRQDAMRRDFTINALYLDPDSGEVLDFTGGRADLEAGVIRAIGSPGQRFAEDHLRMLRAVRLAASLDFAIAPETMRAIRTLAPSIRLISAERSREEIVRILTGRSPRRGTELLDESGLLVELMPEVASMKGVEQPSQFHPEGDVWVHTLLMLGLLQQPTVTLAMGALLHDVGKPLTYRVQERIRFDGHAELGAKMAAGIMGRLRFSNEEIRTVTALVADHLRFKDVKQMRESTLRRFLRQPYFEELLELHRLDCVASHGLLDNYEFVRAKRAELPAARLRPPRLLTGHDLIRAGYTPGPGFAEMLRAVEDAQLESRVATPDDAMRLVRETFGPPVE